MLLLLVLLLVLLLDSALTFLLCKACDQALIDFQVHICRPGANTRQHVLASAAALAAATAEHADPLKP